MALTEDTITKIKNDYVNNKLSIREISVKYNISSKEKIRKILSDVIRTQSEASKLAHEKYKEKFKHSDESKEILRTKRLNWMKNNPDKTAWRTKQISYPEKCFQNILESNGYDKKYKIYREYSVFPYFIDFAFVDLKLAIEIDGSQHLLEDRKLSDMKKDELLSKLGWRILRITADKVIHEPDAVTETLSNMIVNDSCIYDNVGILMAPKKHEYVKKERDENGWTKKQKLMYINNRKIKNRPSKDDLWEMVKTMSFVDIGKKYGVDGNTIKKWCKFYKLPYRKKDIKNIKQYEDGTKRIES